MMPGAYSRDDLIDVVNEQRAEIIRLVQKNTDLIIERDDLRTKLAGFQRGMPSSEDLNAVSGCLCESSWSGALGYKVGQWLRKLAAMQDGGK